MHASDTVLSEAFRAGNDVAFVTLYHRYKQGIYLFCLKMVREVECAKDLVQGVFLKAYERRDQLMHAENFRSWLFVIARNDCLTHLRKSNVLRELPEDVEDPKNPLPQQELETKEEVMHVSRAIALLKPDLREVILLREYEGFSYREIADIIGIPEQTVKSRLFSARRNLFEILKPLFAERKSP